MYTFKLQFKKKTVFHFHSNKWQTKVLQYLTTVVEKLLDTNFQTSHVYQMFSPVQINYLPEVMKCTWCSHSVIKINKDSHKKILLFTLKIFFGISFCKRAKMTQIDLFNPLSMVLKSESEAKDTQKQTGEKLSLEYDKHWCFIYWFRQSLKFKS